MITGIDAGSKFLKISSTHPEQNISVEHYGRPEEAFEKLEKEGLIPSGRLVFTGHYGEFLAARHFSESCDEVAACVERVRTMDVSVRWLVNVGAGSIRCVELDESKKFVSYRENTLCAAGTGSFLDEQMRRMGLSYETLGSVPYLENPPDIATRCAVFAKSDLIHRQQEGYTREQMWNGLCRGVVATMLSSAFKGDVPSEPILFCGGLFLNKIVREWITRSVANPVFADEGVFVAAQGAALWGESHPHPEKHSKAEVSRSKGKGSYTLEIKRSVPWRDVSLRSWSEDGNEIRVSRDILPGEKLFLGVDIGSTSTKCALLDAFHDVVADVYRKTAGNPIEAARLLFRAVRGILGSSGAVIAASATTGSGRKLVGRVMGADLIVNEITAHFAGARATDPTIETIFEIGGQDSKYIRGTHGNVADCNMNFVCAAGTGSFIEEQAGRLGFDVREIGEKVMGLSTPHTSDRCTVFMEQDINKLLREGATREEGLAGVIYSIAKNYMNRVVGARPVTGDKIFFQGATARNRGLVAAFELLTGKQIIVSPNCHVMGAFGAALLAAQSAQASSSFRGVDVFESGFNLTYDTCTLCLNRCTITSLQTADGTKVSWGYKCGREAGGEKVEKNEDHFRKIVALSDVKPAREKGTRGMIGIPRALSMYNYIPLWRTFFEELGFEVMVTGVSSKKEKDRAVRIAKADFCFPVKIALAHANMVSNSELVDAVFFPTLISEKSQKNNIPRVFCPYVISFPSVMRQGAVAQSKVIAPSIDFRFTEKRMVKELTKSLEQLGVSSSEVSAAYRKASAAHQAFGRARYEEGLRILEKIKAGKKAGIAVIGRPYNLYDRVLNLGLTEYFRSIPGVEAFPFEVLLDPGDNDSDIQHIYWNYGEKILYAAEKIKALDNVFPVYFTNFGCGPDSFILTRFEKIMKGKPYLIIELDEHGSDTGYQTRIEAFVDVISSDSGKDVSLSVEKEKFYSFWNHADRKLWLPPLHETSVKLMAAGFRAFGFDCEALDDETRESYEIGKQLVRGSECLPASTTIGAFIKKMRETGLDPKKQAYLMATAEGPCRFGQYMVLHRGILDKNGLGDVEIFAPTSVNSYMGMPTALRSYLWDLVVAGDFVYKYICHRRPYEIEKGSVDRAAAKALAAMADGIERKKKMIPLMIEALETISKVPVKDGRKPLVGIVGEIYVRSNKFCNDNLVRFIEANGGEAWLSPVSEWFIYTSWMENYFSKLYDKGLAEKAVVHFKNAYLFRRFHQFEDAARPYLAGRMEPHMEDVLEVGQKYIPLIFEGETILTIARGILFLKQNGASLVINCSPFGCMPGNVTASIFSKVSAEEGKPVISLFYDGESDMNRIVKIYLSNIKE